MVWFGKNWRGCASSLMILGLTSLLVVACAGSGKVRALNTFSIACDSYASTLIVLASMRTRGKLSLKQISTVEKVRVVTTPICLNKNPLDPWGLFNKIERGIRDLIRIKEGRL